MIKKSLSFLLVLSMLMGIMSSSVSFAVTAPQEQTEGTASPSSAIDAAYAVDVGEDTYVVSDGCIMRDNTVLVSDGADRMLCSDRVIYYSSANKIKTFDIDSGRIDELECVEGNIVNFTLADGVLYIYDGRQIISNADGVILNMTRIMQYSDGEHSHGLHLLDCVHFSVEGRSLVLYFDNPDYDPEDCYENPSQYNIFRYDIASDTLSLYDPYQVDEETILESQMLNSGSNYTIGNNSFPLDEYPVGSFFTKNGQSCTCHNKGICVAAKESKGCNCMRYWPSEAACEIDLLSSQCWGFAEFCEYRAYGYIDKTSSTKFYNAFGSKLTAHSWTANTVKEVFTEVGAGGHLRVGGHSLFVISVSSTGFITYECNKSRTGAYCVVYTNTWTWDSFYSYRASNDILWYYMPKDVENDPIVDPDNHDPGYYQVKASALNLRESPSTSSSRLTLIPNDTILFISEFNDAGTWGKTEYNGYTGWVSMDYVYHLTSTLKGIGIDTLPTKTAYYVGDEFSTDGMIVYATFVDGTTSDISGYTCSGYNMSKAGDYTVTVSYQGFTATFDITVEVEIIPPTSIKLEVSNLALLTGASYEFTPTILPADANVLGLTWESTDPSVASVENGYITTHKAGKTTIKVTTENNLTAKCTLTVVDMPRGTAWSVDTDGQPLTVLPLGITPLDYSVRYRTKNSNGSYGSWNYIFGDELPASLAGKTVQYQYRAITVSFVSDGLDVLDPIPYDINTYIELEDYTLEKDGYLFAGWFKDGQSALSLDSSKAYSNKVMIEADTEFYAGWIALESISADSDDPWADSEEVDSFGFAGADLSMTGDSAGIRFYSRISTQLINNVKKLDNKCEYGTVVILKSALKSNLVISGSSTYLNSKKPVKVIANNTYAEYDGYLLYNALVTGYTDGYIETDFAVRPYLRYRDANGNYHVHYYDCTGASTAYKAYYTNLYDIATEAYKTADVMTRIWIDEHILSKVD